MTFSYMPYWREVDSKVEGASQRIQEDAMNFAKIVESLGLQVVRAIMLLIAFIPILWGLSSSVVIPFFKDISGSLVWVSLTASLGGLVVSWIVGIKLPGLEYNNQKVEAAFRKELVYGEDDRKNYVQAPTILQLFTGIKFNYHKLFLFILKFIQQKLQKYEAPKKNLILLHFLKERQLVIWQQIRICNFDNIF